MTVAAFGIVQLKVEQPLPRTGSVGSAAWGRREPPDRCNVPARNRILEQTYCSAADMLQSSWLGASVLALPHAAITGRSAALVTLVHRTVLSTGTPNKMATVDVSRDI